jgi:hypothetical protein
VHFIEPAGERCWRKTSSQHSPRLIEDPVPLLEGGTGLYVQSVLDGWALSGMGTLRRSPEPIAGRGISSTSARCMMTSSWSC